MCVCVSVSQSLSAARQHCTSERSGHPSLPSLPPPSSPSTPTLPAQPRAAQLKPHTRRCWDPHHPPFPSHHHHHHRLPPSLRSCAASPASLLSALTDRPSRCFSGGAARAIALLIPTLQCVCGKSASLSLSPPRSLCPPLGLRFGNLTGRC